MFGEIIDNFNRENISSDFKLKHGVAWIFNEKSKQIERVFAVEIKRPVDKFNRFDTSVHQVSKFPFYSIEIKIANSAFYRRKAKLTGKRTPSAAFKIDNSRFQAGDIGFISVWAGNFSEIHFWPGFVHTEIHSVSPGEPLYFTPPLLTCQLS